MNAIIDGSVVVSILAATLRIATPLLFAAMGELITERGGIWNMGVEGTMLTAAFIAYLVVTLTGLPWLALGAAILAGALVGVLTGFMTATLRVDHFVTGLAINLLASGLTLYFFRTYVGRAAEPTFAGFTYLQIPFVSSLPVVGPILFSQHLLTYFAFALVPVVWFFLHRTRYGLELRCLGENPLALETKGLRVVPRQYLAIVGGSALIGLGGGFLMLALSDRFLADVTGGRGWLALVAIVAGNWRPAGVTLAVLVFAFLQALAIHTQVVGVPIPYQFFLALPYLASIVLLMGFRLRSGQPSRLGIPYFRN
ncbi:MAG: ABC transporter permease [Devosia sp.]|nr:ABC transporter permease [Devosia sp.]